MTELQLALQIIALLETVEPSIQAAALSIIGLWNSSADVKTVLAGEVTALGQIAAKARAAQGLPPVLASGSLGLTSIP